MAGQLAIILVNYQRAEDTTACIDSLANSTYTNFSIIVVDNASKDGSVVVLQNKYPGIITIENKENYGFSEGNNIGIRFAIENGFEYILLLNNDTVVDKNALSVLINTIQTDYRIGVLGSKILYYSKPNVLWFAGGYFNPNSSMGGHYGIGQIDNGQFDNLATCDYITGCCLLTRSEVLNKVGLLDPDYFAYLEDVDFCFRVKRAGYSINYQPKSVIYHKVSSTSSWDSPVYLYFNMRNKILFLRKNSQKRKWLLYLPLLIYFFARQFVRLTIKHINFHATLAVYYGLSDGLFNNTGTFGRGRLSKIKK
jgi:GT2 family glycosyltransferase